MESKINQRSPDVNFFNNISLDIADFSLYNLFDSPDQESQSMNSNVMVIPYLETEENQQVTAFQVMVFFENKDNNELEPDENKIEANEEHEPPTKCILGYFVSLVTHIPNDSDELIGQIGAHAAEMVIHLARSLISGNCRPEALSWFEEALLNTNIEVRRLK